ncbi:hypothetical protein HDU91_001172, partial [Kappamyces sp. JEL0680]
MDHDAPNSTLIDIALVRHQTTKNRDLQNREYIIFNFGGPGGDGYSAMSSFLQQLASMTNHDFDLISFDPRGTGNSTTVRCAGTLAQENAFLDKYRWLTGLQGTSLDATIGAFAETVAKECASHSGDLIKFMSTRQVAQDMEFIRTALGMPTMRYW